jgi:hypothetical protein
MDTAATGLARRNFLKLAGAAAPAAAAALIAAPETAAAADAAPASGMRDTEHTRAYLESARF